jgi:hypothetical protein
MGIRGVELRDAREGRTARLRLLAPLRYLAIHHPEKVFYDFKLPLVFTVILSVGYFAVYPRIAIFGELGLLKYVRDLLIMGVPFMIGALATVAMGTPGPQLDRRPVGADLILDGQTLTLRQFVCYLLGYLSFLGLVILIMAVSATLLSGPTASWLKDAPVIRDTVLGLGIIGLMALLSSLTVTVLWALYFLTDIVNQK